MAASRIDGGRSPLAIAVTRPIASAAFKASDVMRRTTRFSRTFYNPNVTVALDFGHYNFCRIHISIV